MELAIERTQLGTQLSELLKLTPYHVGVYIHNKSTFEGQSIYTVTAESGRQLEKKLQSHAFGCKILDLPVFKISTEVGPSTLINGTISHGPAHIMFSVDIMNFPGPEAKDD